MEDQARRVCQGKRSAGVGGSHLAGAVADHAVRVDPPRLEQLDERALEHEDSRLSQLAFVKLRLRCGETGFAQRDVRMFTPICLDCVDDAAKYGVGVIEGAATTGPLRSLSGEHHCQPRLALLYGCDRDAFLRNGIQPVFELLQVANCKRGAGGKVGTTTAEIASQRVDVHRPLAEHLAKPPCGPGKRLRIARRKGNDVAGLRSQGR